MSDKTAIEWTDATWNPVRGCSLVSDGCKHCYAMGVAGRFSGPGQPYERLAYQTNQGAKWTGNIMLVEKALEQPLRWTKPRKIFVNSMSDLFHESIPFEYIASVFAVMSVTTRHTYQVLTKRPARMLEFFKWVDEFDSPFPGDRISNHWPKHIKWTPARNGRGGYDNCGPAWPLENVWIGVSVENQASAMERIPLLLQAPAAVHWISAEPLLGNLDLDPLWLRPSPSTAFLEGKVTWDMPAWTRFGCIGLKWVVVGGESGQKARPMHPAWARILRDQCAGAGVPFLFKQWGEWAPQDVPCVGDRKVPSEVMGDALMCRIGKKAAGRLLDGQLHDGYPEVV